MKSIKGSIVCLTLLAGIPVFAQQAAAGATAQQSASASAAGASVNESSNVNASANASAPQMRPVTGELVEKLDSKTAKVGDSVVVKTTASARGSEGVVIPKGTRLVGHVTGVRAHARGSEDSSLTVQFDRAELKGGQSMAIHSVIESISPSPAAMAMASTDADDPLGGGPGGGMRSSGGARGGLGGGALSGTGSLAGGATGALATTTSATSTGLATGNAAAATAGNLGETASSATGSLQTAASGTAAIGAHATAIPGVMLAGDATGATSGTLSASRKNVHLDSGTQIVLGVAAAVNR